MMTFKQRAKEKRKMNTFSSNTVRLDINKIENSTFAYYTFYIIIFFFTFL